MIAIVVDGDVLGLIHECPAPTEHPAAAMAEQIRQSGGQHLAASDTGSSRAGVAQELAEAAATGEDAGSLFNRRRSRSVLPARVPWTRIRLRQEACARRRGRRLLLLQFSDPLLRGMERLVGDDRVLDEQLGGVGIARQRPRDHGVRLTIFDTRSRRG